jgi:hypothetical protein
MNKENKVGNFIDYSKRRLTEATAENGMWISRWGIFLGVGAVIALIIFNELRKRKPSQKK